MKYFTLIATLAFSGSIEDTKPAREGEADASISNDAGPEPDPEVQPCLPPPSICPDGYMQIEACPPGAVLIMDSRKDPRAASAGGILVSRLMKRGVAGVVTDGGFRDSPEIAGLDIPAYHNRPSAPTNLTLHQALEFDVPIGCGDVAVWPGDILVGDGEGVIVLPAGMADGLADEAVEMTAFEDFVTERVLEGETIIGLYPATKPETLEKFAAWRQANDR